MSAPNRLIHYSPVATLNVWLDEPSLLPFNSAVPSVYRTQLAWGLVYVCPFCIQRILSVLPWVCVFTKSSQHVFFKICWRHAPKTRPVFVLKWYWSLYTSRDLCIVSWSDKRRHGSCSGKYTRLYFTRYTSREVRWIRTVLIPPHFCCAFMPSD